MSWRVVIGFALATASTAACSPRPADLGQSPEILWWTDHESGTSFDWTKGNSGTIWNAAGGNADVVVTDFAARSGRYALRSTVTSSGSALSEAIVQRTTDMPVTAAYYSAWYYVTDAATVTKYWLFSKFRSACTASDPSNDAAAAGVDGGMISEVWDLDFVPDGAGSMHFQLFGHIKAGIESPKATPLVPTKRWFQVEVFLRPTNDGTGQLTVWSDDVEIFEVTGPAAWPAPQPCVEWTVGGITGTIAPTPATFYVDDAAISTQRLGTTYPVFWHGN